jgi:hypothetical protein
MNTLNMEHANTAQMTSCAIFTAFLRNNWDNTTAACEVIDLEDGDWGNLHSVVDMAATYAKWMGLTGDISINDVVETIWNDGDFFAPEDLNYSVEF